MASDKEFHDFVIERLSTLEGISTRRMMGEYVLYYRGIVVGGIYDNRLLLKPTRSAEEIMSDSSFGIVKEIPYEGAKEMIAADIDDPELTCRVIEAVAIDLTK